MQVAWENISTHMNTKPPQPHTHRTQEEINSSQQYDQQLLIFWTP
jgi:hypothetical protein